MKLYFHVQEVIGSWDATAYAGALELGSGKGRSPAEAVEKAENAALKEIEQFVGVGVND